MENPYINEINHQLKVWYLQHPKNNIQCCHKHWTRTHYNTLHSTCLTGLSLGTHYDTGNTDNVAYGRENLRVHSFKFQRPYTTA